MTKQVLGNLVKGDRFTAYRYYRSEIRPSKGEIPVRESMGELEIR
jgi:hypothetical protein